MRAAAASVLCLTLLGALTGLTGPARAQPPPPADVERAASDRADDLVKQGNVFAKQDRWSEAEPLYREAWNLKPAYDIAGNLGIAEAALGKNRDAAEHLSFALGSFPASGRREHRKLLEMTLAKVRAEVSALTISVSVQKAEVLVDGRSIGMAPVQEPIFVEPGTHAIDARLAGYKPAHADVTAVKGSSLELTLTLIPDGPVQGRSMVPGIVLGSVAGAALVTGLGVFVAGRVKLGDAHDLNAAIGKAGHSCVSGAGNYDASCAQLYSVSSTSNTFQQAGTGLLIGAGAAAVGAVIFFALPAPRAAASSTGSLRVVPVLSPGSGGFAVSGAF